MVLSVAIALLFCSLLVASLLPVAVCFVGTTRRVKRAYEIMTM